LLADPIDFAVNCELAPDPDGDGWLAPEDCDPLDPAVHPGAGEIVGNTIDEDCTDGPLYLRVVAPVSYRVADRKRPPGVRFVKLRISEVRAGDKLVITCKGGKRKGCAFARKTINATASTRRVDIAKPLKRRYLARGVVLELRLTRPLEIGRVQRFTVLRKGRVRSELLCLNVGAKTPTACA
jgi:hypothetical protein